MGGDEVQKLTHDQYLRFVERVQGIITANGKQMIGWGEIAAANLTPTTIVQHWRRDSAQVHVARGGKVILSPCDEDVSRHEVRQHDGAGAALGRADRGSRRVRLGSRERYSPASPRPALLGVEAPLWSETLVKLEDYEFMAFPRLAALAEVGWSPQASRNWETFRLRLARTWAEA